MAFEDYRYSEKWSRRSDTHTVEVSRHSEEYASRHDERGPNRWCVYAYLYPSHPLFASLSVEYTVSTLPEFVKSFPLHCGPSFFSTHIDNTGKVTCFQIGCDYNHLYDEYFTRMSSPNDVFSVFDDADRLFDFLSNENSFFFDQK